MADDEVKQFMKILVNRLTEMTAIMQSLEEKISLSTRQGALLSKQLDGVIKKLGQMDSDTEDIFAQFDKESGKGSGSGVQGEITKIQGDLDKIPDDLLDDDLLKLLGQDKKEKKE